MGEKSNAGDQSQLERFKEAARNLKSDQSEAAFDQVLRKVGSAKHAPAAKPAKKPATKRRK